MQLFDRVAAKLKNPSIKFQQFRLYRTQKGNYVGAVYIAPCDRSGWYGRILVDGSLQLNRALPLPGLVEIELAKLAANPTEYAATYGHQTGKCCFCNIALNDPRSLSAGYGPVCAENYGLIYPKLADVVDVESKAEKLERILSQAFGGEMVYGHYSRKFSYTEMVHYLAKEAECFWLIDAIASWQVSPKVRNTKMSQGFQIWEFTKTGESQGVLAGAWDTNKIEVTQEIEYTDFPLRSVKLWLENNVLYFPVER